MSDFDNLFGTPKAAGKKGRAAKAKATTARYDPDSGARVMVSKDDPRYDEWMTPAEYKRAKAGGGGSSTLGEGFKASLGKSLGGQVASSLGLKSGKAGAKKAKAIGTRVGSIVKTAVKSLVRPSPAGKATLAAGARATGVAGAVAAVLGALHAVNQKVVDSEAKRLAGNGKVTAAHKEKAAQNINRIAAQNSSEGR